MLGPMDEFPVHQIPQPISWPGSRTATSTTAPISTPTTAPATSSSSPASATTPTSGSRTRSSWCAAAIPRPRCICPTRIDQDRLNQHVLGYRVEVTEPLHKLRIILEETEGIAADLTWNGLFDVSRSSATCFGRGRA